MCTSWSAQPLGFKTGGADRRDQPTQLHRAQIRVDLLTAGEQHGGQPQDTFGLAELLEQGLKRQLLPLQAADVAGFIVAKAKKPLELPSLQELAAGL